MLANEDIYTGSIDPTSTINPKLLGSFYINTKTAKLFVCTDNTFNNNIWKICNPDIKIPDPDTFLGPKYKKYSLKEFSIKNNVWYHNTTKYPILLTGKSYPIYNYGSGGAGSGQPGKTTSAFQYTVYIAHKPMPLTISNGLSANIINPELFSALSVDYKYGGSITVPVGYYYYYKYFTLVGDVRWRDMSYIMIREY